MKLSDLLFIAMGFATIGLSLAAAGATFLRRWAFVRRSLVGLLVFWGIYLVVGTAVAILTPQRVQPIGADRCFDEVCFAVIGSRRVSSIRDKAHSAYPRGVFYIVDVRVRTSRGEGCNTKRAEKEF